MRIDQILSDTRYGDAVTDNALALRDALTQSCYQSGIYAENIDVKLDAGIKRIDEYKVGDCLIHHFAIGGAVNDMVRDMQGLRKIMIYHNITPKEYFLGYNMTSYQLCFQARYQLELTNEAYDLALGVSEFNRAELDTAGYKNTGVLPVMYDFSKLQNAPDAGILDSLNDGYINIMFLGRLSPNKKQDDIIKTFFYYKTLINPNSRLIIAGSYDGMEKYLNELVCLTEYLNLKDVHFCGKVSYAAMAALYKSADIFLSMSEHEGFCVPLLESMYFGTPILAYKAPGVAETLADSGVLFDKKDYKIVAEIMDIMIKKQDFRDNVIKKQTERLAYFDKNKIRQKFMDYIDGVTAL